MASLALEEKINKIRLRNEEIKRRYEEVEADKKNAAKLDALSKPIPQEDWPTRKEPPEFSGPVIKQNSKPKQSVRRHNDQPTQHYTGSGEGKKNHTFADGQGPPPDPKYNFLADSEREEPGNEIPIESDRNRGRNKTTRGGFKRRGSGRDWHAKEHWNQHEPSGNTSHPDYEAWRAERNRIDEARISRQRTAEGNWRREWDNDKFHLAEEASKRENRVSLGDLVVRQEYNENDKHYRSPRTSRISHQSNSRESHQISSFSELTKNHNAGTENEKRVVIAGEKSIKILLNPQGSMPSRSSVMSVKVSSPNIAGTGRVGPRQRPRVMYSSQSEPVDSSHANESPSIGRQKSIDDNTRVRNFEAHKILSPKNVHDRRGKSDGKNPYLGKKEEFEDAPKSVRKDSQKSPHPQRRVNVVNYSTKYSRDQRKPEESFKNDPATSPRVLETKDEENKSKKNEDLGTNANSNEDEKLDSLGEMESNNGTSDEQNHQVESATESKNNCEVNESSSVETQREDFTSSKDESYEKLLKNVPPENSTSHENAKSLDIIPDTGKCNDSVDDIESSEAINCINSGDISNDSGFVEMPPSNGSIHEISDKMAIEMNKVDNENSENVSSIESRETEQLNNENIDDRSSSNDPETLLNDTQSAVFCDAANSCEDEKNKKENTEKCEVQSKDSANSNNGKTVEIPRDANGSENPCSDDEAQNIQENLSVDIKDDEIRNETLT